MYRYQCPSRNVPTARCISRLSAITEANEMRRFTRARRMYACPSSFSLSFARLAHSNLTEESQGRSDTAICWQSSSSFYTQRRCARKCLIIIFFFSSFLIETRFNGWFFDGNKGLCRNQRWIYFFRSCLSRCHVELLKLMVHRRGLLYDERVKEAERYEEMVVRREGFDERALCSPTPLLLTFNTVKPRFSCWIFPLSLFVCLFICMCVCVFV